MERSVSFVPQSSRQDNHPRKIFIDDVELVNHDIYRGDPTLTPQTPKPESVASQNSFPTESSNSFRLAGGRIGALATRLERAITRWARKNGADSSSSLNSDASSSSSSRSSFRTANKSTRRKRRPPGLADIQHRMQSEQAVAARIRARELRRTVPREFNLYIPPLCPSQEVGPIQEEEQVVRTFSLDAMLPHLESVLRKPGKPRRSRHRSRAQPHHSHHFCPQEGRPAKDEHGNASGADVSDSTSHKEGKGKHKLLSTAPPPNPPQATSTPQRDPDAGRPLQAWWLDVASPSWEDLRTLGRLLHLHPLTLEDILQQDPREKLELFPKLGYSFIVFRAVESPTAHERLDVASQKTGSSQLSAHGVVDEFNVYLVVFRHGICTFHFSNISEHLDRVRGKLQTAAQTARRSSAWIAHGILDSVVDSFFPFVEEIEEQVTAIEAVVYNEDSPVSTIPSTPLALARALKGPPSEEKALSPPFSVDEKQAFVRDVASVRAAQTQFSLPRLTFGLMWWRMRRAFSRFVGLCLRRRPHDVKAKPIFTRASLGLWRMARTRRLVTSVARVLATKPEVVAGIRKRLLTSDGLAARDDAEVAIYFGDVQDHILTLQQSLAHFERMLSESHPTYLQILRLDSLHARARADYAALILGIAAVVVLPPQVLCGLVTLNVTIPRNNNGEYWIFAVVLVLILFIQFFCLGLVRYWWVNAKRRHRAML
ncbi:hypothetical protein BJV78DRAFT_1116661 [Lactifluus subvellereus]|nr:hypothetical protein BJV78DRAFT_1116661 [Lactifluus subvellereus]